MRHAKNIKEPTACLYGIFSSSFISSFVAGSDGLSSLIPDVIGVAVPCASSVLNYEEHLIYVLIDQS